jgi:hypothetical protein
MGKTPDEKASDSVDRLDSEGLAALIVDALLRANVVKQEDVQRAMKIATEEIEVRKVFGDY